VVEIGSVIPSAFQSCMCELLVKCNFSVYEPQLTTMLWRVARCVKSDIFLDAESDRSNILHLSRNGTSTVDAKCEISRAKRYSCESVANRYPSEQDTIQAGSFVSIHGSNPRYSALPFCLRNPAAVIVLALNIPIEIFTAGD
jgi:hypothetical protein